MSNKMNSTTQEIRELILGFSNNFRRLEKSLIQHFGVTPQQAYTLNHIGNEPGMSMYQIGDHLGVAISTISRNIEKLERDNLVIRKRNELDSREVSLYLTELGEQRLEMLRDAYRAFFSNIISKLEPGEGEALVKGLQILLRITSK